MSCANGRHGPYLTCNTASLLLLFADPGKLPDSRSEWARPYIRDLLLRLMPLLTSFPARVAANDQEQKRPYHDGNLRPEPQFAKAEFET
jgi:hypothetical protein